MHRARTDYVAGMPQLSYTGLSENWLLKTCGDLHWQGLAALAGVVPSKYVPQMLWEMECCEREWSDFVSYCPAFPAPINLFVRRLPRDGLEQQRIAAEITQFNREVDEIIEKLTGRSVDEYLERLGMSAAVGTGLDISEPGFPSGVMQTQPVRRKSSTGLAGGRAIRSVPAKNRPRR